MAPALEELVTWARRFREEGPPFMVVGACAVAVHGLPRSSSDIDIVIHVSFEERGRVEEILHRHAIAEVHDRIDPQWGKRLAGKLPSGLTLDLFFTPPDPVHDREYSRRVLVSVDGDEIPFISAEDLIPRKLVNLRLRRGCDFDDAVGVIATQGARLDLVYLRAHAAFCRVGEILERAVKDAAAAEPDEAGE